MIDDRRLAELEEIADGSYGDNPTTRGLALGEAAAYCVTDPD